MEVDRADAKGRTELTQELKSVLANVRAAVTDWKAMQANMHVQADTVDNPEGRALLHWLADGAMTLLGYEVERPGEKPSGGLGIMKLTDDPTDEGGSEGAIRYFEGGGPAPLIAKADMRSPVHRRVPLDLIVVPLREKGEKGPITGIGVHVGLWTSQALTVPSRTCRCCAASSMRSKSRSASIPRAITARRCATRSPRCRATCSSTCAPRRSRS